MISCVPLLLSALFFIEGALSQTLLQQGTWETYDRSLLFAGNGWTLDLSDPRAQSFGVSNDGGLNVNFDTGLTCGTAMAARSCQVSTNNIFSDTTHYIGDSAATKTTFNLVLVNGASKNCLKQATTGNSQYVANRQVVLQFTYAKNAGAQTVTYEKSTVVCQVIMKIKSPYIKIKNSSGSVKGDPHFIGFNGDHYEFQGEAKKWFNLISDTSFSLNGLLSYDMNNAGTTYFVMLAFLIDGHELMVDTTAVTLDGKVVFSFYPNLNTTVNSTIITGSNGQALATLAHSNGTQVIVVSSRDYQATIEMYDTHQGFAFLNTDFDLLNRGVRPHGLIGQTAGHRPKGDETGHQGEGEIEGVWNDYLVPSAFAVDFKYSKYIA